MANRKKRPSAKGADLNKARPKRTPRKINTDAQNMHVDPMDKAFTHDKEWFDRNPYRKLYVRLAIAGEHLVDCDLIIVQRPFPGFHIRYPLVVSNFVSSELYNTLLNGGEQEIVKLLTEMGAKLWNHA